jgi:hypothetical protein
VTVISGISADRDAVLGHSILGGLRDGHDAAGLAGGVVEGSVANLGGAPSQP